MAVVEIKGESSTTISSGTLLDGNAQSCIKNNCRRAGIPNPEADICTPPDCNSKAECTAYCLPNPEPFCQGGTCCCW